MLNSPLPLPFDFFLPFESPTSIFHPLHLLAFSHAMRDPKAEDSTGLLRQLLARENAEKAATETDMV